MKHFYHATTRKLVVAFGQMFKDIWVARAATDGAELQRFKVPLAYAPKNAWVAKLNRDSTLGPGRQAGVFPRMAFEIVSFGYDESRKLTTLGRETKVDTQGVSKTVFNPVPYNLAINLYIGGKISEDCMQVMEQIIPYFAPATYVKVKDLEETGSAKDVAVVLNAVSQEDNYQSAFEDNRMIIWTLSFTVKAHYYGAVADTAVITKVQNDFLVPLGDSTEQITPEDAALSPRISRITTTPDPADATADEDYGFSQEIEDFSDGKRFNPVTLEDEPI